MDEALTKLDTIGIAALVALFIWRTPVIIKEVQVIFNSVMETIGEQQAATLNVYREQITRILDTNDVRHSDLSKGMTQIAHVQERFFEALKDASKEDRDLLKAQFEGLANLIVSSSKTMSEVVKALEIQGTLSNRLIELKQLELTKSGVLDHRPALITEKSD